MLSSRHGSIDSARRSRCSSPVRAEPGCASGGGGSSGGVVSGSSELGRAASCALVSAASDGESGSASVASTRPEVASAAYVNRPVIKASATPLASSAGRLPAVSSPASWRSRPVRCPPQPADLFDDHVQALALYVLHREVVRPFVLAHSEDRHDVRVVQPRGGPRLELEPLDVRPAASPRPRQHFERDCAGLATLHRLVNDAHPAAADLAHDLVFPEPRGGACRMPRDAAESLPETVVLSGWLPLAV